MLFVAVKYTFTYFWLFAILLQLGRGQDISKTSRLRSVDDPTARSSSVSSVVINTPTRVPSCICLPRGPSRLVKPCFAPPQPVNGEWRLREDFCADSHMDCKVPEGTPLELGYQLVYTCPTGYRANGNNVVYCKRDGNWSSIPDCVEIKCGALNSVMRIAYCSHSRKSVSCDFPVSVKTRADVSCRPGYREDMTLLVPRKNMLTCNEDGEWDPHPPRCIPVCGKAITHQGPLVFNGSNATIGDFPWHVSLYVKRTSQGKTKKDFICGATLIQNNFLLTAAHCVYDMRFKTSLDPKKLLVVTGNIFREHDHPSHDLDIVRKAMVKTVHIYYTYIGLLGNFASDIALLELERPFEFSEILLPACLDNSGYNAPFLELGVRGKVAGFGTTATGKLSPNLQTITVPYIPYNECKNSTDGMTNDFLLTKDKFCAGYTTGSALCEGDSGGGLVFRKNDQWYIMGIVSVSLSVNLDSGERMCPKFSYTLYTRVSEYMDWILGVISNVAEHKSSVAWSPELPSSVKTTTTRTPTATSHHTTAFSTTPTVTTPATPTSTKTSTSVPAQPSSGVATLSSCLAPPQPTNGIWRLDSPFCVSEPPWECRVSQGTELEPGTHLVYSCYSGYNVRGNIDVHCRRDGSWSALPVCVEIKCGPLNSHSRKAICTTEFHDPVNCNSPVPPETVARLECRDGYKEVDNSEGYRGWHFAKCNVEGLWDNTPIECEEVCGEIKNHRTSFWPSGTVAKTIDFPWHASIYLQKNTSSGVKKDFRCSATIIKKNLVLTAAHCVYDEKNKTATDPNKLFIMTGNKDRDYDSPLHDPSVIRKHEVKNVYEHCQYYGRLGNYGSDIALLELKEPFEYSDTLSPVCLDGAGYDVQILDSGASGSIASFRRTVSDVISSMQIRIMPYIPNNQCKSSRGVYDNEILISRDKFCAGYNDGSNDCESGGGLVFNKFGLWYVLGIASVGVDVSSENGERTCDRYSYSLFTKVSDYMDWIRKITSELERYGSYPSCKTNAVRNRR